jgi:chemotaxis protein MotB
MLRLRGAEIAFAARLFTRVPWEIECMRVGAVAACLTLTLLPYGAGCTQNPYMLQSQNQALQQAQMAMQQRTQELQSRASTLDQDNQELQTVLAQSRQQSKLLEDQVAAMRDQLGSASAQLAALRDEKQLTEKQAEALMASTRKRVGASITANSSLSRNLPAMNLPGVEVRIDGDVVRIELPAAKLFPAGAATLQPGSTTLLDGVAHEVSRAFPEQLVGIEGHTDNDPIHGAPWGSNHQFSIARSLAVYQYLTSRGQMQPNQLFVVGHGMNHPVVSNATPAGKSRNSRVELVVYPEKAGGRQ